MHFVLNDFAGSTADIKSAHASVQEVISSIESQRDDNEVFPQLVAKMKSLLGGDLQKPRVTGRQTQRSNYDVEEAGEFYRVSL